MRSKLGYLSASAVGMLVAAMLGCEGNTGTSPPPSPAPPARQTEVQVGPNGVDVEVGKDQPGGKKVDVEVGGGRGVNVDVDGKKTP